VLPLEAKVCVVTGASSGIGEAIAYKLAVDGGAYVACVARRTDKLRALVERIKANGGTATVVQCDIVDRQQVSAMVREVESTLGGIHVLVNNAGVMLYTKVASFNEQYWHREIDLNCTGTMNVIGAVLPGMVARRAGHVVNMTSDAGKKVRVVWRSQCMTRT
jgi:NADP-dependent 3-hydroxy acid dehydrogenase YdfG